MAATYEKACKNKVRYDSRSEAKKARRRTPSSGHLTIYPCPFCDFFHLGHLPIAVRRGELDKQDWRNR